MQTGTGFSCTYISHKRQKACTAPGCSTSVCSNSKIFHWLIIQIVRMAEKRPLNSELLATLKKPRVSKMLEIGSQELDKDKKELVAVSNQLECIRKALDCVEAAREFEPTGRLDTCRSLLVAEIKDTVEWIETIKNRPLARVVSWLQTYCPRTYSVPLTQYQRDVNKVTRILTDVYKSTAEERAFLVKWFSDPDHLSPDVCDMLRFWDADLPRLNKLV